MCGILGIYKPGFDPREAERRLRRGAESLKHRGPDASGVTMLPSEGVGFGHCRLAILDLDPRANQPMASADGRLLITFNGEIYNFRELKEDLKREGASFRTESDTEVLLEGYRLWGLERLLSRLRGMFAFALFDQGGRRLILARDRAGKKPLYYSDEGAFCFASELRGLLSLAPERRELDGAGLDAYLSLKFVPSPRTLLRAVRKLPPGFCLVKEADLPARLRRYWQPFGRPGARPESAREALERLEEAFTSAVRRRLVSDVPVCLFLSGGVDSSLIAAYLDRIGVRDTASYTIGYPDVPGCNEFEFARLVSRRFPIRRKEIVLSSRQALETLEDEAAALDEPISDWVWVPLYHLSRAAHEDGFKVALVGEGSDELFIGYDVMLKGLRELKRFQNPLWRALARAGASLAAPIYRVSRRGHTRFDLIRRAAAGEPVYLGSSFGFGKSQRRQIAGPSLLACGDAEAGTDYIRSLERAYVELSPDPRDSVNLISFIEFYSKMGEVLLQRVDRVTMLQSLEARSPFLDHELVELAFAIPGPWKIRGGRSKALLKELARRVLPEEIVGRKKMGFSFPFKEWLRGELGPAVEKAFKDSRLIRDGWINGEFCRDLLREHRSGRRDCAPRIWMLFDLCRWFDRWIAR